MGVIVWGFDLGVLSQFYLYKKSNIKIFSIKGTNACDRTNGNCNQLCLPNPDYTRQCACSDESNSECLKTL